MTCEGYREIARELKKLAGTFWLLEGGYDFRALSLSVASVICELAGIKKIFDEGEEPEPSPPEAVRTVETFLKNFKRG
jgi:acetoin utilization deacetylase AcuC-like enzyme